MKVISLLMALLVIMSILPIVSADDVGCVQNQDVGCVQYQPRIDVVFVIDSTGSMADEIRTVQTHLTKIIKEVENGQPRPYLRVGLVTYRDHELEESGYLYRKFDLTDNTNKIMNFIWEIEASGGGDLPEAVADGLDVAINQMDWGYTVYNQNQAISYPETKRIIFLIGDAAPHGEGSTDRSYAQGCPDGHSHKQNIEDARNKGIVIYTASGSGIDSVGVNIFRQIASLTGGSYTQLSYMRQDVEQYYRDEGFAEEQVKTYATEAKKSPDYDKKTNSILTNTLGVFAKASMQAEAMDMGVEYDEPVDDNPDDWIDVTDITGDSVVEIEDEEEAPKVDLYGFFKGIFDKLVFWR